MAAFSGTAIEKNGQMYIYYTSVHYLKPNPENIHINFDIMKQASR